MKKVRIAVLLTVLALSLSLVLVSCKDKGEQTQPEPVHIDINTTEDFIKIKDYLGSGNSHYVFELKADLDFADTAWTPIGETKDNGFSGTLNGNGHKLKNLNIDGIGDGSPEQFRSINSNNGYVGLFGVIYNGKVQDLTLENLNMAVIQQSEYGYFGGLAGYSFGNTVIKNVSISGKISLGTAYEVEKVDNGYNLTVGQRQYVGGLFGSASGEKLHIENVTSTVEIDNLYATYGNNIDGEKTISFKDYLDIAASSFSYVKEDLYPNDTFIGGIIGYCDCTYMVADDDTEKVMYNSVLLNNYSENTKIKCMSKAVYAGGLYGYVSGVSAAGGKILTEGFETAKGVEIECEIIKRGTLGVVSGLFYKTKASNLHCDDTTITAKNTSGEAYNIGGIAGYVAENSELKNSVTNNFQVNSNGVKCFVGGITAVSRDSEISACKALGGGLDENSFTENTKTAGVCYSVVGNSHVSSCTSSFKAYYGGVGISSDNIYVNKDGNTILRFVSVARSEVFIGVYAEEVEEGGVKKLKLTFYDESREPIGDNYFYTDYEKDETIDRELAKDTQSVEYLHLIESYAKNYFNEQTGCLLDEDGMNIILAGRELNDYKRVTGVAVIEEITFLKDTAHSALGIGEEIENIG